MSQSVTLNTCFKFIEGHGLNQI